MYCVCRNVLFPGHTRDETAEVLVKHEQTLFDPFGTIFGASAGPRSLG